MVNYDYGLLFAVNAYQYYYTVNSLDWLDICTGQEDIGINLL